jgi:hypothetical protein
VQHGDYGRDRLGAVCFVWRVPWAEPTHSILKVQICRLNVVFSMVWVSLAASVGGGAGLQVGNLLRALADFVLVVGGVALVVGYLIYIMRWLVARATLRGALDVLLFGSAIVAVSILAGALLVVLAVEIGLR